MDKRTIDIVTVSKYGRPEHYYWVLQEVTGNSFVNTHIGKYVKTEDEAYDDLGEFVGKLIDRVVELQSSVSDLSSQVNSHANHLS